MASTSSSINEEYDVFLSFRAADSRKNFTSHLYNALCEKGVKACMDKDLRRGEEISTLFQLIESSKISIVIFSQNYASSHFCMDELVKILECKVSRGLVVLPVFYRVDPSEVENQTGSYGEALSRYEDEFREPKRLKTSYNGEETIETKKEKVQRWRKALGTAAELAGWDLRDRDEPEAIRRIVREVLQFLNHELFPVDRLVGKDFKFKKKSIFEWLMADGGLTIGIWGMGGVGKSTLLKHVCNKLMEKQEVYGRVYWVTVSKDFSVRKLQDLIAAAVELKFGTEKDKLKRAARLSKKLLSKGKFVLILDDLWNHFHMGEVGIPIENNGCKLIVTTRSREVCTRLNLQKLMKIGGFFEEEAWYLFKEKLGHDLPKNVEPIAKNVVKECGGLPLGIVTMAGSMRGVKDIYEWRHTLTELQKSEVRPHDTDEVFRILRFCYTHLEDKALQQCLLYCALYPEDYKIRRAELIDFLMAEGIIKRQKMRQLNFDEGHSMLNKLVRVSLLENVEKKYFDKFIKMHDLVRDMAIQIMKESFPSIIEAGRQLIQVPKERDWIEGIVWVSLMKNDIAEIPSNYSPMCSTLSTLLLSESVLYSIPDSFFLHFHGLKVLDLSRSAFKMLPESVGRLGNLKALSLELCPLLHKLPSLGGLRSLEKLDLSYCISLEQVPEGLELLSNLRFLNLCGSGICELQSDMLTGLSHLQFLAFYHRCSRQFDAALKFKAAELVKLQKLEFLRWRFLDCREFNEYVQLVSRMERGWQIFNYNISVGSLIDGGVGDMSNGRKLIFNKCEIDTELFIQKDLETLEMWSVTICNGSGLHLKTDSSDPELMSLQIESCKKWEYLFHLSLFPSILGNLKTLILINLPELRALFGKEVEETPTDTPLVPGATTFQSLRIIEIDGCHSMKSLCFPRLFSKFRNLEEIKIINCSKMEVIVAATEDEISCGLTETFHFNLLNLRFLKLEKLPKLKRIGCEQIVCDSLQQLIVRECDELEKIPMSLPLLSLQKLKVWPEEWWKSVEWGSPHQKSTLRPQFVRYV